MSQEWVEWRLVQGETPVEKKVHGEMSGLVKYLEGLQGELNSTHQASSEDKRGSGGEVSAFMFPMAGPGHCSFNLALHKMRYKGSQWEWNHVESAFLFFK